MDTILLMCCLKNLWKNSTKLSNTLQKMWQNKQYEVLSLYSCYTGYLILFPTVYHLSKICRLIQLREIKWKSSMLFKAHSLILWTSICLLGAFHFCKKGYSWGGVCKIIMRENIFCKEYEILNLQAYSHQDSMVLAQRQIYRSMEQNRKPRDKSTNLWSLYLQQRRQGYTMEKRQPL